MADISLLTLGGLFLLALVAGTIDAMAGGGGLLVVPGLMAAGFDPISAFANSKLQGVFNSLSATLYFRRKGKINLREHGWPALTAFLSSVGGAALLSAIDPQKLKIIVPFLLIAIALWVLFSPQLGAVPRKARLSFLVFSFTVVPLIGFYNGFLGPCTGTFYAIAIVALGGLRLDEATVRAKLYNVMGNIGGLIFFTSIGHVDWLAGAVMVAGATMGGAIGARLIVTHGTGLIKPLLVVMSLAMSAKLLWQQGIIAEILPF